MRSFMENRACQDHQTRPTRTLGPNPDGADSCRPRVQSGAHQADRMEQTRVDPVAQSGAHQTDRMERTGAHHGALTRAHQRTKSGRHPEAQDLENANEPDHTRLAEKAGDNEIVENPAILGVIV
ncbi:hypothetical protein V6N13_135943 [Hibiscus sabdariffa]